MNWDNVELSKQRKLYTGKAMVKVVAVNPDAAKLAELRQMDVEKIKEPSYEMPDGNPKIVVYVVNADDSADGLLGSLTFFPTMEEAPESSKGSIKVLNTQQQTTWLPSLEDTTACQWFNRTGVRRAKGNEAEMYDFFINWVGINAKAGNFVLPFEEFCSGDVTTIQNAIDKFTDNTFCVLLGVNSGKYQEVYPRKFSRGLGADFNNIQWGQKDFTLDLVQEYVPPKAPNPLETDVLDDKGDLPF